MFKPEGKKQWYRHKLSSHGDDTTIIVFTLDCKQNLTSKRTQSAAPIYNSIKVLEQMHQNWITCEQQQEWAFRPREEGDRLGNLLQALLTLHQQRIAIPLHNSVKPVNSTRELSKWKGYRLFLEQWYWCWSCRCSGKERISTQYQFAILCPCPIYGNKVTN